MIHDRGSDYEKSSATSTCCRWLGAEGEAVAFNSLVELAAYLRQRGRLSPVGPWSEPEAPRKEAARAP